MNEKYTIPEADEDLLEECDVETFGAGGPGGQHVNRRETAVRLTHRPTGLVVSCQQERSQYRNKKLALENLRQKLEDFLKPEKPRKPTSPPDEVREKILEDKKRKARKKELRKSPDPDSY